MAIELRKVYNPQTTEDKWYSFWLEKNYFHAVIDRKKKPFCIVIPPPNITGSLHMGHALNNTLQDIVVRKKRMQGYATLWLPGTDHAGIATQNVVEQQLQAEGLTRQDLGREKFIERVWQWKEIYGSTIIAQLKRLGCSCDWQRERFTMDEGCSKAVRTVFIHLYQEGLIYRGDYIINWCPRCHTALSDIEVEHEEVQGNLWYIKYYFKDSDEYLTLATTRPETLLGDTAVAVHPDDDRYKKFVGRTLILPVLKRELPLIADDYVDRHFGTGVVKVTPAHDPNDFEIGLRQDLPQINIFTPDARINENGGKYQGMDRYECREAIIKDLEQEGLIEKVEPHVHSIGHCYRCGTVVEPYLSRQWFVKMKPLAEPAIKAVEQGKVKFVPERWVKLYYDWMHQIRDWCISRQIWWGHRLPVYYCQQIKNENCQMKNGVIVSEEKPKECPYCGSQELEQDPDVLDTWFSSALWPFSTLGWPEATDDLKYFYPTSLLSTGFDIIFFWVARMIMMGLHFCNDVPFREVYIHALIRDAEGKKMSKSTGNVIDPLDMVEKYGADALRFTLASMAVPGRDVYLSEERIEGCRNFTNKIWNASRFVLMNLEDYQPETVDPAQLDYTLADRWILSRYTKLSQRVDDFLQAHNFSEASKALYEFIWGEFCDWYVELCKPRLYGGESGVGSRESGVGSEEPAASSQRPEARSQKLTAQHVLCYVLDNTLRLLHPFMPFISEEIWQKLPACQRLKPQAMAGRPTASESIMMAEWPVPDPRFIDESAEGEMALLQAVIVTIRRLRSGMNIPLARKAKVMMQVPNEANLALLKEHSAYIYQLASVDDLQMAQKMERPAVSVMAVEQGMEIFLPLAELIDVEKEYQRLTDEIEKITRELELIQKKLSNKEFVAKAPPEVVEKRRQESAALKDKKKKLAEQLGQLKETG